MELSLRKLSVGWQLLKSRGAQGSSPMLAPLSKELYVLECRRLRQALHEKGMSIQAPYNVLKRAGLVELETILLHLHNEHHHRTLLIEFKDLAFLQTQQRQV